MPNKSLKQYAAIWKSPEELLFPISSTTTLYDLPYLIKSSLNSSGLKKGTLSTFMFFFRVSDLNLMLIIQTERNKSFATY